MSLNHWIKQYSTVEIDDGEVLTAKQVKEPQLSIIEYMKVSTTPKDHMGLLEC